MNCDFMGKKKEAEKEIEETLPLTVAKNNRVTLTKEQKVLFHNNFKSL